MRRPRRLVPALVLLLAALPAAGCDDSATEVEPQTVSGFWLGLTTSGSAGQSRDTVELLLSEAVDGSVTGTAVLRTSSRARVYAVQGANDFPDVFLVLSAGDDGNDDLISLRAEFSAADVLRARLDGGGFNDRRADFFRRELRL